MVRRDADPRRLRHLRRSGEGGFISVAKLDRSLQAARAKVARQRAGNAALSATEVQLTRDLEAAQARLAQLRTQLGSTRSSEDYEAVRREYESLEAAIQALNQQIEEGQR